MYICTWRSKSFNWSRKKSIYLYVILVSFVRHGRLRLDKKSIIRQYRNLQRAKTNSNIISHYTVHVLRTTNHTYFETFSKHK